MVILRQERIFYNVGKGKFNDCWLIIEFDAQGPTLTLFKDSQAKKLILEKIELRKVAPTVRFGTTCRPYGGVPGIKKDNRVHPDNFMCFQVQRLVKRVRQPKIVWLCTESTKQMVAILKIFAACLTFMKIPAPRPSQSSDGSESLAKYRPRLLIPVNEWELFWESPPPARLLTELELSKAMTRSTSDLAPAPSQGRESMRKSKSASALNETNRPRSGSLSSVSTRSSVKIPIHELLKETDMPKSVIPKPRMFEKAVDSNHVPVKPKAKRNSSGSSSLCRAEAINPLKQAAPPPPVHTPSVHAPPDTPLLYQEQPDKYVCYLSQPCCEPDHQQSAKAARSSHSSAYSSGPVTPTHVHPGFLRRASELSLRPVVRRPTSLDYGRVRSQEVQADLGEPVKVNGTAGLERRTVCFVSRGIQTDHELADVRLIDDFGFAQTKRFNPYEEEVDEDQFRRLSASTSLRSVYLRHLEDDEPDDLCIVKQHRASLIDQTNDLRAYQIEVSQL